ncbi:MAG: hypothetical protein UT33_C0015G0027 [Candidatus Peregrinibacteria bacterium GW2011_GWC2_39_14]|nr:MAG: hypothetical protein US92_C0007G0027 [Candidatus Peregrinibacteria bacterium GW2011_GWA2_38_36]KKR04970.1 MAG: hypothetical protein UT33_C0015G0027 [Candidatus Peregrinibacteria bacterium GW2011_GWC2_39_14]
MFKIELGQKCLLDPSEISGPILLLGIPGQGKSVTMIQMALTLIKNKQKGLFFDTYGDLAETIKKLVKSKSSKANFAIFDANKISEKDIQKNIKDKFVIVFSRTAHEGFRKTRAKANEIVKKAYKFAQKGDWIIADQAFDIIDDVLLEKYLQTKKLGIKTVLADQTIMALSDKEKLQLKKAAGGYVIYKVRGLDANWFPKNVPIFKGKKLSETPKYEFYFASNKKIAKFKGVFPLKAI